MRLKQWFGISCLAALSFAGQTPRMVSVEPASAKPGAEITVSGEALSKEAVIKVYLSDGKTDSEVTPTSQEDTAIKFKIPDAIKPGRYGLAILTKTNQMIDQPVRVTVE